ncbi:MAG: hypothetical protein HUJ29_03565 [Gammaproteobacteria bacterium]|nr:hypothetical protein [Gammaproteobacteria bacterium]
MEHFKNEDPAAIEWLSSVQALEITTMKQALSGIRFPDRQENLKLLSNDPAQRRTLDLLVNVMMQHSLLAHRPDTRQLMNDHFLK